MPTLMIPGLRWPRQALQDLTFDLPLPGLCRLLRDAHLSSRLPDDALLATISVGIDSHAAACRLLGLGYEPGTGRWVCLDPVGIRLGERGIGIVAGDELALESAEAEALVAALAEALAPLGRVHVGTAGTWHLELHADAPEPGLPPLASALGQGSAGAALSPDPTWRAVLNAAQIALHAHAVNRQRRENGRVEINSLWPWGCGPRPAPLPTPSQYTALACDDPVLCGWARAAGLTTRTASANANEIAANNPELVVLDALSAPQRAQNAIAWRDALAALERNWFLPLATERPPGLVLILPDASGGLSIELGRRAWWRRALDAMRSQPKQNDTLARIAS